MNTEREFAVIRIRNFINSKQDVPVIQHAVQVGCENLDRGRIFVYYVQLFGMLFGYIRDDDINGFKQYYTELITNIEIPLNVRKQFETEVYSICVQMNKPNHKCLNWIRNMTLGAGVVCAK